MSTFTTELTKGLDARIADLRGEESKLNAARAALVGAPARPVQKLMGSRPKLDTDGILEELRSRGPSSSTQLAAALRGSPNTTLRLLRELEDQGSVRRSGERRLTRWTALS